MADTVGVPQVLDKNVVLGGINRQSTAGAVPNAVNGLAVSVPPDIFALVPAPELPVLTQVVTKVKAVLPALTAEVTRT